MVVIWLFLQVVLASEVLPKSVIELERCYPHPIFSEAFCGRYSVPEDRDQPERKTLDLNILLVPSVRANARPDPIFVFVGGPGQGAVETASMVMPSLLKMNQQRTIVFIDQRGMGKSNRLDCMLSEQEFDVAAEKELKACKASFSSDINQYRTEILAQDTAEIQNALGFSQINIYGTSYGTRLGLSYLRQYPELVRSAVLDGIAPPDIPIGSDYGLATRKAFQSVFSSCMADIACREAFPDIQSEFNVLEQKIAEEQTIRYLDARSAEVREETLSKEMFWGILQQMLYDPVSSSMIPYVIHQANKDNWSSLMAWNQLGEGMMDSIPLGVYLSIVCAEDIPRIPEDQSFENMLGGDNVSTLRKMCSVWNSEVAASSFFSPVSSDIPVLLLSGEYDPVTPPQQGERAIQTLSNAKHVVVPGMAHNTLRTSCVLGIVRDFLEDIDPKHLDVACVLEQERPPFVLSTAGAMP